jgi:hypothetical protein
MIFRLLACNRHALVFHDGRYRRIDVIRTKLMMGRFPPRTDFSTRVARRQFYEFAT